MGLAHHHSGPPAAEQIAQALPVLGDRSVAQAVALSVAYGAVRHAFLALSGISLMQSLGRGSPDTLAGVVVSARAALEKARGELSAPARFDPLRRRARLLAGACDVLDTELEALVREGRSSVSRPLLDEMRRVLTTTSLVEAGMRQFTSTSCSAYHRAHGHSHEHGG